MSGKQKLKMHPGHGHTSANCDVPLAQPFSHAESSGTTSRVSQTRKDVETTGLQGELHSLETKSPLVDDRSTDDSSTQDGFYDDFYGRWIGGLNPCVIGTGSSGSLQLKPRFAWMGRDDEFTIEERLEMMRVTHLDDLQQLLLSYRRVKGYRYASGFDEDSMRPWREEDDEGLDGDETVSESESVRAKRAKIDEVEEEKNSVNCKRNVGSGSTIYNADNLIPDDDDTSSESSDDGIYQSSASFLATTTARSSKEDFKISNVGEASTTESGVDVTLETSQNCKGGKRTESEEKSHCLSDSVVDSLPRSPASKAKTEEAIDADEDAAADDDDDDDDDFNSSLPLAARDVLDYLYFRRTGLVLESATTWAQVVWSLKTSAKDFVAMSQKLTDGYPLEEMKIPQAALRYSILNRACAHLLCVEMTA